MTSYTFEIPGTPVAKARPRASRRGDHVVMYTPTASKNFEFLVKTIAVKQIKTPLKCPVSVTITFEMPRPKRLYWKTRPMLRCYHDKRPDIDNLAKSVIDGLNSIAYIDDAQVVALHAVKWYHSGNSHPKTIIEISPL